MRQAQNEKYGLSWEDGPLRLEQWADCRIAVITKTSTAHRQSFLFALLPDAT